MKGIDTNPLWRNIYTAKWPRKSKWPELYFKTKGITREQELWKIYYLQRLLQEAVNGCNVSGLTICSPPAGMKYDNNELLLVITKGYRVRATTMKVKMLLLQQCALGNLRSGPILAVLIHSL